MQRCDRSVAMAWLARDAPHARRRAARSIRRTDQAAAPRRVQPRAVPVLSVRGLCVARGGVAVLEGVSFTLRAGRALVLQGPNGIGKTTLLRTLAGLQPPLAGEIAGAGERVAYAGHADGVKAQLSVAENLRFWARVFGREDIGAALATFDLDPMAHRPAATLSAGQRRRLGLARMMVTGRPVWMFDEPTVSLDAASVARFAGAVRAHLGGGGAALMATHVDLGLAEAEVLDLRPWRAGTGGLARAPGTATGFEEAVE